MDEKIFYNSLNGKWKLIVGLIKEWLIHDLYLVYTVEAYVTLN